MRQPASEDRPQASGSFPTTHWSEILVAGQQEGTPAHAALGALCQTYWYPIYAIARWKGHQPADSEDLTQAFFTHLVDAQLLRKADPQKGRFRSFLLGCFNVFLVSERQRALAGKRGGGSLMLSIDLEQAENRFAAAPLSMATPEQLFDRQWAVATLDAALARLEAELKLSRRAALFEELLQCLQGDPDRPGYAEIARRFNTTEGTIKVTVYRLRRRYRELVRAIVSQTVNNPMDVEDELAHLAAALRG